MKIPQNKEQRLFFPLFPQCTLTDGEQLINERLIAVLRLISVQSEIGNLFGLDLVTKLVCDTLSEKFAHQ